VQYDLNFVESAIKPQPTISGKRKLCA